MVVTILRKGDNSDCKNIPRNRPIVHCRKDNCENPLNRLLSLSETFYQNHSAGSDHQEERVT